MVARQIVTWKVGGILPRVILLAYDSIHPATVNNKEDNNQLFFEVNG